MSVTYTCPECGAKVRPAAEIAPGKKLRCPKCQAVFVPIPLEEEATIPLAAESSGKKPAKAKQAPPAPPLDPEAERRAKAKEALDAEFEDRAPYAVAQEKESPDEESRKPVFGSIRDRYPKSKRGPATKALVKPTNLLIIGGLAVCIGSIIGALYGVWPMIFDKPTQDRIREGWQIFGGCIGGFVYGAIMLYGAHKMQVLESYTWAMIACCMGIPILIGIPGLITLREKFVIEGFEEKGIV